MFIPGVTGANKLTKSTLVHLKLCPSSGTGSFFKYVSYKTKTKAKSEAYFALTVIRPTL